MSQVIQQSGSESGLTGVALRAARAVAHYPTLSERPPTAFNHDIMSCTAEGVVGNHLYSGRALGATEPGDLIQIHPDLRPQWDAIHRHYERVGLRHTSQVLWDVDPSRLAEHTGHEPSVFFFGPAEHRVRPDLPWYRAVGHINSKNNFMALARDLGIATPRTWCFESADAIGETALATASYPCYLKAAISVSGVGIYRCADAAELTAATGQFAPAVPVQIQDEVRTDTFLNLQYEIVGGTAKRLAATEQVLEGCVHQGNRHPAAHAPWDLVEPMAGWLAAQGMRGVFAFDAAVIDRPGGAEYLAIECNPRWNGASYPTMIARKLGIEHWLARTFPTRHRRLADIDLAEIEYDHRRGDGVILVNWGPVLVGKLLVLIAGEPARQQGLAEILAQRL